MKNFKINMQEVQSLTKEELININGGADAYDAGHATGEFVRKVVGGTLMIVGLFALYVINKA